jgi:hypothetical protein
MRASQPKEHEVNGTGNLQTEKAAREEDSRPAFSMVKIVTSQG